MRQLSDAQAFLTAFATRKTGHLDGDDYKQPDNLNAARDETYAESHATFLVEPATLQAVCPAFFAYWQKH